MKIYSNKKIVRITLKDMRKILNLKDDEELTLVNDNMYCREDNYVILNLEVQTVKEE